MANLSTILTGLQRGWLRNVLEGAGITFITAGASLTAFNIAVSSFQNSLNGLATVVAQFAGLLGLDISFSLVLGAIATRYIQNSARLHLARK